MSDEGAGWRDSAAAWIAEQGAEGDFGRRHVLDAPMLARIGAGDYRTALDIGCGEGRFCRMMRARGLRPIGVDPTEALLERARALDPAGDYRLGRAEALDQVAGPAIGPVDLVVSYLSLIDIDDPDRAIAEMVRVLRPGGMLLIANLSGFFTAGEPAFWRPDGTFAIDRYLEERAYWAEWRGIRIRNWHRPLQSYMRPLLENGLQLRYFAEPGPDQDESGRPDRYRRVPFATLMEWRKPA